MKRTLYLLVIILMTSCVSNSYEGWTNNNIDTEIREEIKIKDKIVLSSVMKGDFSTLKSICS